MHLPCATKPQLADLFVWLRYVQFAPVAYIVKLHIELSNASLIAKVVRNNSKRPQVGMDASNSYSRSNPNTDAINPTTSRAVISSAARPKQQEEAWEDTEARGGSSASDVHLAPYGAEKGDGIMRTVETVVVVDAVDAHDKKRKTSFLNV